LDDVLRIDLVFNDAAERRNRSFDSVLLKASHDIECEGVRVVGEEHHGHVPPALL